MLFRRGRGKWLGGWSKNGVIKPTVVVVRGFTTPFVLVVRGHEFIYL